MTNQKKLLRKAHAICKIIRKAREEAAKNDHVFRTPAAGILQQQTVADGRVYQR
jgi:hypothetical protein